MNAECVPAATESHPPPTSRSWWADLAYYLLVPKTWLQLTFHNTWGILNVLDFIWLRPLPGGLIDLTHPFCTGINPHTGQPIWTDNILFRSPKKNSWRGELAPDGDEELVRNVGDYLRRQV